MQLNVGTTKEYFYRVMNRMNESKECKSQRLVLHKKSDRERRKYVTYRNRKCEHEIYLILFDPSCQLMR